MKNFKKSIFILTMLIILAGNNFALSLESGDTENYDSPGGNELYYRMILAVVFVIVLGVAAVYVSRKLLPRMSNLPSKKIRLIETIHLGPHRMVHLLEVGGRRLVVGSTNENVSMLADVTVEPENNNTSAEDISC